MHQSTKRATSLIATLLGLALAAGCATTKRPERHAHRKSHMPRNYSLYKRHQINEALLRRGERQNAGPALDEY